MKVRRHYGTDLTEKQWRIIAKLLPNQKKGRKPIDRRRIINALFYLVRTGCQWRNPPKEFPKWKTVYTVFRRRRIAGVRKGIHDALDRIMRKIKGKKPTPSIGTMVAAVHTACIQDYDGAKLVLNAIGDQFKRLRVIVERTFAWINKYRRNSKDYERNPENSVAMIHLAMTAKMLRYLQNRKITV